MIKTWSKFLEKAEMEPKDNPSIMFTDVVGSSKLWADNPDMMRVKLDDHFKSINDLAKKWNGFVVKTIGDAFMVYFDEGDNSLLRSINCAIEFIKSEDLPLRVGICCGEMDEKQYVLQNVNLRDFFGNVVNTASRMESKVADTNGISFSYVDDISDKESELIKKLTDKYSVERIEYSDDCSSDKENLGKRSSRLLTDIHIDQCRSSQELKGVKELTAYKLIIE